MAEYTEINWFSEFTCSINQEMPIVFLKFCNEAGFADDVINGNLYSNTIGYFREKEKVEKKRGQGDKHEAAAVFDKMALTITNSETGEEFLTTPISNVIQVWKGDEKIPIVSFVGVPLKKMLRVAGTNWLAFPFTEEEYCTMASTFGTFCAVIDACEVLDKFVTYCKKYKISSITSNTIYSHENDPNRLLAYFLRKPERFIYKDNYFEYQKEYRIVPFIEMPKDHFIRIGKLSHAFIMNAADLPQLRISVPEQIYNYKEDTLCSPEN